jgi:signal peptidase II
LLKQYVVGHYNPETPSPIIGDWLRIDYIHNRGGLFGLFQGSAIIFAIVTVAVAGVLAGLEFTSGWRSWIVTVTLGLLLGGAIGNLVDRIVLGYVVDFADIGIGAWRFYIFNVADSAVSVAICIMLGIWILGPLIGLHLDPLLPAPAGEGEAGDSGDAAGAIEAAAPSDEDPAAAPTANGEGR